MQWTLGTAGNQLDKSKFNTSTATLTGADASNFAITETANGFRLDDNIVIAFRYEDVYLFPLDYNFNDSRYDWSKMQFFNAILESKRFIGATKRFYIVLDNGDKFLSTKPGTFAENYIQGDGLIVGIHQDDIHLFKAPDNLMHELSLM